MIMRLADKQTHARKAMTTIVTETKRRQKVTDIEVQEVIKSKMEIE